MLSRIGYGIRQELRAANAVNHFSAGQFSHFGVRQFSCRRNEDPRIAEARKQIKSLSEDREKELEGARAHVVCGSFFGLILTPMYGAGGLISPLVGLYLASCNRKEADSIQKKIDAHQDVLNQTCFCSNCTSDKKI